MGWGGVQKQRSVEALLPDMSPRPKEKWDSAILPMNTSQFNL